MNITMRDDRVLVCDESCAGTQGEHNATTLAFTWSESHAGWTARVEFLSAGGHKTFLPLENGAVTLPAALTRKGPLRLQLVLEGPAGEVFKSRILRLDIADSVGALEETLSEHPGGLAALEDAVTGRVLAALPSPIPGPPGVQGLPGPQGPAGEPWKLPEGYFLCTNEEEILAALKMSQNLGYGYIKLSGHIRANLTVYVGNIVIDGYGALFGGRIECHSDGVTIIGINGSGVYIYSRFPVVIKDCFLPQGEIFINCFSADDKGTIVNANRLLGGTIFVHGREYRADDSIVMGNFAGEISVYGGVYEYNIYGWWLQ